MPDDEEIRVAAAAIRSIEDKDESAFEFLAHARAALEAVERLRVRRQIND